MMCNEEVLWAKDEVAYNVFRAKYAKDEMESPAMFCQRVASICDESIRDRVECLLANVLSSSAEELCTLQDARMKSMRQVVTVT